MSVRKLRQRSYHDRTTGRHRNRYPGAVMSSDVIEGVNYEYTMQCADYIAGFMANHGGVQ